MHKYLALTAWMLLAIFGLGLPPQQQVQPVSGVLTLNLVPGTSSFKVILSANVTSVVIVNPTPGTIISVIFTENATGGFTVAFGGNIANPCTVTTTANATTICQFQYDSTNNQWTGIGGSGGGGVVPAGQLDPTQAPYNVKTDVKSGGDGTSTNTSPTFSSTNQSCVPADVGKLVMVVNPSTGAYPYGTGSVTVLSCNAASWTLSTNAGASATTNENWAIGSANGSGLASARTAAIAANKSLAMPCGTMIVESVPFDTPASLDFAGQNQDIIGCQATNNGTKVIIYPTVGPVIGADRVGFAGATGVSKTGACCSTFAGLTVGPRFSNVWFTNLGGVPVESTAANWISGFEYVDHVITQGFNQQNASVMVSAGGESHLSHLNLQPGSGGNFGGGGGVNLGNGGQGTLTISDSILAYIPGTALSCLNAFCNIEDSYFVNNNQGISCGGSTCNVNNSNLQVTGGSGSNGAVFDSGVANTTINISNSTITTAQANFTALSITGAGSMMNLRNDKLSSTTAGCIVVGTGTINDQGGNTFASPLNGTGNCIFSGTFNPVGGGSLATNKATAATNFGTALAAQTVLATIPAGATYDVKIGVRQVTAGVGCGVGSNTVTPTLNWTSGGAAQATGSNGVPALNVLTISANGSVGSSSVYTTIPVHVDINTSVTFTAASVLASTGCTTTPQYVMDFSTI